MNGRSTVVGVDVGGTFTDLFFYDEKTGEARTRKVPSTKGDQSVGFIEGIAAGEPDFSRLAAVVHGTTVGTNALLERKGARTGVIMTAGFRDVLEMRRRDRRQTWGLWGEYMPASSRATCASRCRSAPWPTAPSARRKSISRGGEGGGRAGAARTLAADAIAIVFINAYANAMPTSMRRHEAVLRAVWPNRYVSVSSHDILPEIREFERSVDHDAQRLSPAGGRLVSRRASTSRLREAGSRGSELLIVQSNGGVMSVETAAARLPIRTALSGPAAGVIAAAHIAATAGYPQRHHRRHGRYQHSTWR